VDWLNYHHLRYVWAVARQGSIGRAAKSLRVAPPTVSAQIHQLEETLGHTLFVRRGRNLVPTEMGEVAARFGDQIFSLGQALVDELSNRASRPQRLVVGVSDVLARSIVHRILEPAFRPDMNLRVVCRESRSPLEFDTELARHTMDVVLSNAPATRGGPVRMYSHPLGECGTTWFAAPALARKHRRRTARALGEAPLLLPTLESTFRHEIDRYLAERAITPAVRVEADDASLVCVLGQQGLGIFAAPDVIEREVRDRYRVVPVARTREIRHRFYAISVEREIRHPGVAAICASAREGVFE